jgi:16S rRNA (uracil1498-N3)-methyltransferase
VKRFILETEPDKDGLVRLGGDDYNYLVRVRRLAVGERFAALLPGGIEAVVQIASVENHLLVGEVSTSEEVQKPCGNLPPIILLQSMLKGDKMDLIVRQAAESSAAQIVPFASAFSVVKLRNNDLQKLSRWQRIVREARQQSGSAVATVVHQPVSIEGLFAHWEQMKADHPGIVGLLFHHLPLANERLHRYLSKGREAGEPEAVAVAIGPEGGFSPAEAQRFLAAGFKPFTIEDTVLRSETAALYAQAAVRIILSERDSWQMN